MKFEVALEKGEGCMKLRGVDVTWLNALVVTALVATVVGVWELLRALWRSSS